MVSATEILTVAELLQVSPEGLQKAITFKVTVSAGWGAQAGRGEPGPRGTTAGVGKTITPLVLCAPTRKRCGRRFLPP